MKIKVYKENGSTKVVRVMNNGEEVPVLSNIADGEVVIIDIAVANISVVASLDSIRR